MKPTPLAAVALLLVITGCGNPEPTSSTPPPVAYDDCVAAIPMDPDKVQEYIDAVNAACGDAPN